MFCPKCGTHNADNAATCTACGGVIQVLPSRLGDDRAMRVLLPVGRSGWAIAAGYAGLFAFLVLPAPLALILGIVAIIDMKKHPEKHGMGRAIFGLVVGALGSLVLLYLLVDALK